MDASGELPDGRKFRDIRELKRLLLDDERQLARNLAQQLVVYATGAPVRFGDRPQVEQILDHTAAKGYGVQSIHIQRAPVAGRIADVVYRPGRFYAAFRSAASRENEQNIIYIHTPQGQLVFKQIAGAIARRVLCWKEEGEMVALGERMGMIRFGSRVDVWLPMDAEVVVKQGQMVKGGESILAKWNSTT